MRIAFISDVHANLPALEAVLEEIGKEPDIEATYHPGDLVGFAPWPNETVDLLVDQAIAGVAGNYDSTVATDYPHCGCLNDNSRQEELSRLSYEWTRANVTAPTRAYLRSLPFRLDLRPFGGHVPGPTIVLLHGAAPANTLYWTGSRSDAFCRRMAAAIGARRGDVVCIGHTHIPWYREVDGIHIVNAGSVGRPKDGDWRAGYVILDVTEERIAVEFRRTDYDLDHAVRAIHLSELPDEFADYLVVGATTQGKGGPTTARASRK